MGERLALLYGDLWRLQRHAWHQALGLPSPDPVPANPADERFADPLWSASPYWDLVKEWYLTLSRHTKDTLRDTPGLADRDRRRALFWGKVWLDALAPTNFLWTNPVALRKAMETGGESLIRGFENFLADLAAGSVRMTDPSAFRVGENLATTPGSVVLRNPLLEVIHYAPTQPRVHAEPVVIVTPWINKFYVLDLTPKKSLVRFLLDQGLDVYITSWKNPGASERGLRMDDYLHDGIHAAVELARRMSGAARVHAVGYCIGGTALASIWPGPTGASATRHSRSPTGRCSPPWSISRSPAISKPSSTRPASRRSARRWRVGAISTARKWPRPSACCAPTA